MQCNFIIFFYQKINDAVRFREFKLTIFLYTAQIMLLSSSHHQYPHKNNQYELVEKSEKKTSALFPLYIEQNTKNYLHLHDVMSLQGINKQIT